MAKKDEQRGVSEDEQRAAATLAHDDLGMERGSGGPAATAKAPPQPGPGGLPNMGLGVAPRSPAAIMTQDELHREQARIERGHGIAGRHRNALMQAAEEGKDMKDEKDRIGQWAWYRLTQADVNHIQHKRAHSSSAGAHLARGSDPYVGQVVLGMITADDGRHVNLKLFLDGDDFHWATGALSHDDDEAPADGNGTYVGVAA